MTYPITIRVPALERYSLNLKETSKQDLCLESGRLDPERIVDPSRLQSTARRRDTTVFHLRSIPRQTESIVAEYLED